MYWYHLTLQTVHINYYNTGVIIAYRLAYLTTKLAGGGDLELPQGVVGHLHGVQGYGQELDNHEEQIVPKLEEVFSGSQVRQINCSKSRSAEEKNIKPCHQVSQAEQVPEYLLAEAGQQTKDSNCRLSRNQ